LTDYLWELPQSGGMRVPARIYATEKMLPQIFGDNALQQAANVAHLPGIVTASLAMPDIHWDMVSRLAVLRRSNSTTGSSRPAESVTTSTAA
jgi:hypothetical protein